MSDKKLSQSGEFDKLAWDWTPVECVLKTSEHNRRSVQWQLAPSIILTNPTSTFSDPNVRLFIDTEKSLTYTTDLGWNWHKSWNLPNISIRLQVKDEATGEQLLTPKNIYAQIFAVKKNGETDRSQKIALLDVGIRGESKMQMVDGQVYFSAMKFSSTSYNNEGQNFYLLIVIYIQENQSDKPKVLTAVISPQIFVDSRRSARDYHEKKFNSFVEPFSTDQLEKEFIKRENKSRTEPEIQIRNDPQGFYNYLTAPNIRHKVKHPIFLSIRFSNCISILYNQEKLVELLNAEKQRTNLTSKDIIEIMQKKLLKQSQTKNMRQQNQIELLQEKLFLFVVKNLNDSLKRKKVLQSIQTLQSQSFSIVEEQKVVPKQFKKFTDLDSLSKVYKENFQLLRELCRKYVPSDEESGGDESDEEYGREEQCKKMKTSRIDNGNGYILSNNSNNNKKLKNTQVGCQAMDKKSNIKTINQPGKNDKKLIIENSHVNNSMGKGSDQQKQIKKQETEVKENQQQQNDQQVPFSTSDPHTNNQKLAQFASIIGSKEGSAFNNYNYPPLQVQQKDALHQQLYQANTPVSYGNYVPSTPYQYGIGNMGSMRLPGLGNFGIGGIGQNINEMNLPNMNNISAFNSMNMNMAAQGIQGVFNMAGLQNVGGMQGYDMMGGMSGMPGMSTMNGMNLSNFQMFNPSLNGFMANGNGYPNYSTNFQNNVNSQAKSLENLLCNNLRLSNWLNSVKSNNANLLESMKGCQANDQQIIAPPESNNGNETLGELSRMYPQFQEQQSLLCLLQQINLYRQLLAQVTYQNQLLGSNVNSNQGVGNNDDANLQQCGMMQQDKIGKGFQFTKDCELKQAKEQHKQ